MSDAELLMYDTRARERLLHQGALTPEQIRAYLDALPELMDKCEALPVDQPALLRSESERHAVPAPARAVEPPARVVAAPPDIVGEDEPPGEPESVPDSAMNEADQPSPSAEPGADQENP
jgi:hypothetical protein